MKHRLYIIMILLIVTLSLILLKNSNDRQVPKNVNRNARWIGGKDGGYWFEIVSSVSDSSFRIKIYNDPNGDLETDEIFYISSTCIVKQIDSTNLLLLINGYDGKRIIIESEGDARNCYLETR
ncbi:hypothetical protein [Sediminibacterium goheungense]|uniref:Uncharacterized protein n=1 Tax=Sediminibacterium goheungense TaxID=1086393 RepID=A0A4R6J0G8_9BACT|nr:hypothetical protein [Sediminibacterium goheungense]TDO28692.1 hypothetical protein BC659_0770 [Sediminibacterium goheungense]